jgi:hypothetical protein
MADARAAMASWRRLPWWKWLVVAAVAWVAYSALKPGPSLDGAPNVNGLTLPVAEQQLRAHEFSADVHDDALFGVLVPSHFTVCQEHSPDGHIVVLDVAKQC